MEDQTSTIVWILCFFLLCSPIAPPKELFCEMKEHKKIIEKGVPEDVLPGLKGRRVSKICMYQHTCNYMCGGSSQYACQRKHVHMDWWQAHSMCMHMWFLTWFLKADLFLSMYEQMKGYLKGILYPSLRQGCFLYFFTIAPIMTFINMKVHWLICICPFASTGNCL